MGALSDGWHHGLHLPHEGRCKALPTVVHVILESVSGRALWGSGRTSLHFWGLNPSTCVFPKFAGARVETPCILLYPLALSHVFLLSLQIHYKDKHVMTA